MVNFGPLVAEILSLVWGTPANFNGFRVLAALLQASSGVSQTLRRWTEGATYVRQGDHHVWHWPTFLVDVFIQRSTIRMSNVGVRCWFDAAVTHSLTVDVSRSDWRRTNMRLRVSSSPLDVELLTQPVTRIFREVATNELISCQIRLITKFAR